LWIKLDGKPVYALFDTGSMTDIITLSFMQVMGLNSFWHEKQLPLQLGAPGSHVMISHGMYTPVKIGNTHIQTHYFDVANIDRYDVILGMSFAHQYYVIPDVRERILYVGGFCGECINTLMIDEEIALIRTWRALFERWECPDEEFSKAQKAKGPLKGGEAVKRLPGRPRKEEQVTLRGRNTGWETQPVTALREMVWRVRGYNGSPPPKLPPLQEVNHSIPLIDETKVYSYYLPKCADAYKEEFHKKVAQYVENSWWEVKAALQVAPMLCIPKSHKDPGRLACSYQAAVGYIWSLSHKCFIQAAPAIHASPAWLGPASLLLLYNCQAGCLRM
jgi:hypothetical protein